MYQKVFSKIILIHFYFATKYLNLTQPTIALHQNLTEIAVSHKIA